MLLYWTRPRMLCFLYLGVQNWTQHSRCSLLSSQGSHFPWPAGYTLNNAAQHAVRLCCCKGTLLAHVWVVHHDPQVLSKRLCSSLSNYMVALYHRALDEALLAFFNWLFCSFGWFFKFAFLNFKKFLSGYSSSLLRSPWITALPSSMPSFPHNLMSPANEDASHFIIQVISEEVKYHQGHNLMQKSTTPNWLPVRLSATNQNSLSLLVQSFVSSTL